MSEQPRRVAVDGAQRIGSGAPYETIQLRLVVEAEAFEEALRFYRDGLGLPEEFDIDGEDGARVVALQVGRATLELINPAQRRLIDRLEVGRPEGPLPLRVRVRRHHQEHVAALRAGRRPSGRL